MKYMRKRIISLFLAAFFILILAMMSGISAQNPLKGIALGDSVPAYFGTDEKDGYVSQLSGLLKADNIDNNFTNLAVSGLNTQTLLEQLNKTDILAQIKDTDIITLNIGGNNILTPFTEMMANDFEEFMNATDITKISMAELMKLMTKKLTEQQIEKLMEGVALFEKDFPEIIKVLHTEAADAEIFVNTVYNPIPPILGMYEAAETLIPLINKFIHENAENLDYIVVDIYSVYKESSDQITNFDLLTGSMDIHPNAAGHALIAQAVKVKITENIAAKPIESDSGSADYDSFEDDITITPEIKEPVNDTNNIINIINTEPVADEIQAEETEKTETAQININATQNTNKNTYASPTGDELLFGILFIFIAMISAFIFKNFIKTFAGFFTFRIKF